MSDLAIDTDAARRSCAALVGTGDRMFTRIVELREHLDRLRLGAEAMSARLAIERATEAAWTAGTLLGLVADAAEAGDSFTAAAPISTAFGAAAGLLGTEVRPVADRVAGWSPLGGDLGGTNDAEPRRPYAAFAGTPTDRGRGLLMRALADTADSSQIREDEFEIVRLHDDRYVVVLPGVTDLARPDLFLDDEHRSVRDLDHAAVGSAWSSSVADNPYARMVWEGLAAAGVPRGADLLLVGHSFGADTATDLAADPDFNGGDYRVTHVVAAGYHVDPHLSDVPERTEVLVLQNRRDAAVLAEAVAHSDTASFVAGAVPTFVGVLGDALTGDPFGALDHAFGWARQGHEAGHEIADLVADRSDDLALAGLGLLAGDIAFAAGRGLDAVTLRPGVRADGHTVVDVFDGGGEGLGHDQSNYVDHLADTDDPAVLAFLASLDTAGYTGSGSAVAVDVSVPGG